MEALMVQEGSDAPNEALEPDFDWRAALQSSWYGRFPGHLSETLRHGAMAEVLATIDPASSAVKGRIVIELLCRALFGNEPGGQGLHGSVGSLLRTRRAEQLLGQPQIKSLIRLVNHGNSAAHGREPELGPMTALDQLSQAVVALVAKLETDAVRVAGPYVLNHEAIVQGIANHLGRVQSKMPGPGPAAQSAEDEEVVVDRWRGPMACRTDGVETDSRAYLVRSHETTLLIELNELGRAVNVGTLPDLWFGHGESVWEWTQIRCRLPVQPMHSDEIDDASTDGGVAVHVPIEQGGYIRLRDGASRTLQPEGWRQGDSGDWLPSHRWPRVEPIPFAGRYAAIFGHFTTYSGGAHCGAEAEFETFRLTDNHPVSFLEASLAYARANPDVLIAIRDAWNRDVAEIGFDEDAIGPDTDPTTVLKLNVVGLDFTVPGRVRVRSQWTGDACYAASDGRWSDETRSIGGTHSPDTPRRRSGS